MRLMACFLCFVALAINAATSAEPFVDDHGHFKTLTLNELADLIRTKRIYDPQAIGLPEDAWSTNSQKLYHHIFFRLRESETFFAKTRDDLYAFERNAKDDQATYEAKRNTHFLGMRADVAKRCIQLQAFFTEVIDKEAWKTNPFLKTGWIVPHSQKLEMSPLDDEERKDAFERYSTLFVTKIQNQLPTGLEPEYEQLKARFDKETKIQMLVELEFSLQNGVLHQQTMTLKESHKLLLELYSMEPRADEELLELIKDSKYPKKEKVKILMELGIPYDNYRVWESQDGLFKTNAKYISSGGKDVTLEKPDGKQTTIELSALRKRDQEYVREQLSPAKP